MTQLNPGHFQLQQFTIRPRQTTFSPLKAGQNRPGETPLLAPTAAACTLEPMTIAVLLVHGFGGDTDTWDTIAPQLGDTGLIVERLSLSGHGSDAAALATTPWTAWVEDMRSAVAQLRDRADRVVLVGYSLGATTGLFALAEHLVDAAVLISPSVDVSPVQRTAVGVLSTLRVPTIPRRLVGTRDDDTEDEGEPLPVAALAQNLASKAAARDLELTAPAPTLLVSGGADEVVGPDAAGRVLAKFPQGTRLITLAGGEHDLPGGPLASQVADLIGEFVSSTGRAG